MYKYIFQRADNFFSVAKIQEPRVSPATIRNWTEEDIQSKEEMEDQQGIVQNLFWLVQVRPYGFWLVRENG